MRALVVGSITRDTNIFDGVAQHTFGGTALYAARTYAAFGIDVRWSRGSRAADEPLIAAELPGVRLVAQPSPVTTTFENSYGANDERTQRVTGGRAADRLSTPDYFDGIDWLHLGPLHPHDLDERWLREHRAKPAGLDLQGFARRIDGERVVPDIDARVVDLLPRLSWLKASRIEWQTLQAHLHISPLERPARNAIETLVTDGADGGILLRSGQRDVRWAAAPPVDGCDPTGAGDVFFAAYLYHRTAKLADAGHAPQRAPRASPARFCCSGAISADANVPARRPPCRAAAHCRTCRMRCSAVKHVASAST